MLDGYLKTGRIDCARNLFDRMTSKCVVAWTNLVSGGCRVGRIKEARALFDLLPTRKVWLWTAMVQGYVRGAAAGC
jgi:pentatricopeptide repeat protein